MSHQRLRTVGVEIVGAIGRRPGRRIWTITGVSTDSRAVRPGEMFFALAGARCDGHDFVRSALERGAACAVVSRDVDVPHAMRDRVVKVQDTLRALCQSARAYRRTWGGKIIAVTGSNGKTTTREMIYHILSAHMPCHRSPKSFNTDVGVSLTLFQAEPTDRVIVLEMGTNAPGEIAELTQIAEPDLGVITNIGETHLEGLGSIEGVAKAKAELLDALGRDSAAFLNADDPWFEFLAKRVQGKVISYGTRREAAFRGHDVQAFEGGHSFIIRGGLRVEIPVPGRHNVLNALAALAVADYLGLCLSDAAARMATFRLPEMRYQVEQIRGITVVFDGYNANPGSMSAAIAAFSKTEVSGRRVAVLGDMMELGLRSEQLHRALGAEVARSGVSALWAVGKFAPLVARSAEENGLDGHVSQAEDVEPVLRHVCEYLQAGDAVLVKGSRGMKMERLVEELRALPASKG
ncbi:MAG: UDP-N-acetylmuramoyl-tripeptide--D-alanyl-D-alanine ligase [Candidatus Brocadiia bacterium]